MNNLNRRSAATRNHRTHVESPDQNPQPPQHSRSRFADLATLDEITGKINSSVELPTVLREVTRSASQLLGIEASCIYLLDPVSGEFVARAWEGVHGDSVAARVKMGDALTGLAAQLGDTLVSNDFPNDPRLGSLREVVLREGFRAAVHLPIDTGSDLVSVLTVATRTSRKFTTQDVSLLYRFAARARVAMRNACVYEREREAAVRLYQLNELITKKQEQLARSVEVCRQLTEVGLVARGLDSITATLASLVANPVVVVNPFFDVISWTAGMLAERRVSRLPPKLESAVAQSSFKSLLRIAGETRRPARQEAGIDAEDTAYVVAPIVGQDFVLGYVSVFESVRSLEELDHVAIEHATTIMASAMLRDKQALEVEMRLRGDFLEVLLSADSSSESIIVTRAAYLGYNLRERHCFIAIDIDDYATHSRTPSRLDSVPMSSRQRLLEVVNAVVRQLAPRSLVIPKRDTTIIIMLNVAQCESFVKRLLEPLHSRIEQLIPEVTVSLGVGSECSQLADFRRSYEEARRALSILKKSGRRAEILSFEQLDVCNLLVGGNERSTLDRFVDRVLGQLVAYDRSHDSQLVASLDVYLQNNQNLRRSARALVVSKNTLAYRLQRIYQLTKIKLDDAEARLRAEVALHLLKSLPD